MRATERHKWGYGVGLKHHKMMQSIGQNPFIPTPECPQMYDAWILAWERREKEHPHPAKEVSQET